MCLISYQLMEAGAPGQNGQAAHGPAEAGYRAVYASVTTQRKAFEGWS